MKTVKKDFSIEELEERMLKCEQVNIPVEHNFSDGIYSRQIKAPKGSIILGHKHKKPCLNILAQGKMLLKADEKDNGKVIEAPYTFKTDGGVRKIAYIIEDVVFINIFKTDKTDLKELEEELIEKSKAYLGGQKCLG